MAALTRYSNKELLDLPDCKELKENGKCRLLRIPACTGSGCSYYQDSLRMIQAQKRLSTLDEDIQAHISTKYYGGLRPWSKRPSAPQCIIADPRP